MYRLFVSILLFALLGAFVSCGKFRPVEQQGDAELQDLLQQTDRFDSVSQSVRVDPVVDTLAGDPIEDSEVNVFRFAHTRSMAVKAVTTSYTGDRVDSLTIVPYPVTFEGSTIRTSLQRSPLYVFTKPFTIDNCTIDSTRHFLHRSNLNWSAFKKRFTMSGNSFQVNFRIAECVFDDTTVVVNPWFQPLAAKERVSYLDCSFASCIFKKGLFFTDRFLEKEGESVLEPAKGSRIKKDLYFYRCRISGKLDLSQCRFDSNSRFVFFQTPLPDTLDLVNTKFTAPVDLTGIKLRDPNTKCQINLMGCDIDKIKLGYGNFHLYIPDSLEDDRYSRDQISATYEALLNNFQKSGFKDSYRQLAIEYKDWQANNDFPTWVGKLWWGYGFRKWQLLIWTAGFLLLFSLLNLWLYKRIYSTYPIKELDMTGYAFSQVAVTRFFQRLLISTMYTGWIFFRLAIDFDRIRIQRLGWLFVILIEYLVGLLCTAYLVNWILTK